MKKTITKEYSFEVAELFKESFAVYLENFATEWAPGEYDCRKKTTADELVLQKRPFIPKAGFSEFDPAVSGKVIMERIQKLINEYEGTDTPIPNHATIEVNSFNDERSDEIHISWWEIII